MKRLFSAFVLLSFLSVPLTLAISPAEVNAILQKKRDPYLKNILKAHDRAVDARSNSKTTVIERGLWRNTQSLQESAIRTRPSYTMDSFRMQPVREQAVLEKPDFKRTGITRRTIEQPRLWSRRSAEMPELRVRKFNKGGDAFKINAGTPEKSLSEQQQSYLKRKRYDFVPLDTQ